MKKESSAPFQCVERVRLERGQRFWPAADGDLEHLGHCGQGKRSWGLTAQQPLIAQVHTRTLAHGQRQPPDTLSPSSGLSNWSRSWRSQGRWPGPIGAAWGRGGRGESPPQRCVKPGARGEGQEESQPRRPAHSYEYLLSSIFLADTVQSN